ncbi:hypothetical protein ACUXVT_05770 [Acinetobacter soli]|uniref:hypothetical protein n=1 Tax=Acinetobacter soli TaxID=487316 RepID=UPI004056EC36
MIFPKKLNDMKPQERWDWYERQKQILRDAAKNGVKVELTAELSEYFMFMNDLTELKHCQMIAMHNNAMTAIGSALIKQDDEMRNEWLLNTFEQGDDPTYQMYKDAHAFFDRKSLPFPESVSEHRQNIEKQNAIFDEDNAKFKIWYQENIVPILKGEAK